MLDPSGRVSADRAVLTNAAGLTLILTGPADGVLAETGGMARRRFQAVASLICTL